MFVLGAIVGDVLGAYYENSDVKEYNFPIVESEFTDDTVCTMAVWDWLLHSSEHTAKNLIPFMVKWVKGYPNRGYGGRFQSWITHQQPYESIGNGCAMRCSPISLFSDNVQQAVNVATQSALISHNHPESVAYTQITAVVGSYLKQGYKPQSILEYLQTQFPLIPLWNQKFEILGNPFTTQSHPQEISQYYYFVETVALTVLPALSCLIHAKNFESGVRLAVSLGGDADTLAAIVGAWMECRYGMNSIPPEWLDMTLSKLDGNILRLLREFPEYRNIGKHY